MLQIDYAIRGCPYGAAIEDVEGVEGGEPDLEKAQMLEHLYLRHYLKKRTWIPILVGVIEEVAEVWICPDCQKLIDRARERPEG